MSKPTAIEQLRAKACSDGNCAFRGPQSAGQHTNGGCHCLNGLPHETRNLVRAVLVSTLRDETTARLNASLKILSEENEALRSQLKEEL